MKPERVTKLLAVTSWAIPAGFVILYVTMPYLERFWFSGPAIALFLTGLTFCALVLAVVCGFLARGRSRRLHGGKYLWLAMLGFYVSLTILLSSLVLVLAVVLGTLLGEK